MLSFSEACERNKQPILSWLIHHFASVRDVLEIASGTGQHAIYFASHLAHLQWQPSDLAENLPGITARVRLAGLHNVSVPIGLDVADDPWPIESTDAIFSANSLHIMSWTHVEHFFGGVGRTLEANGLLCVYGPFQYAGAHTSRSNAAFDASLRTRDPLSGVRDFAALDGLAATQHLEFVVDHEMPANNRLLLWKKR